MGKDKKGKVPPPRRPSSPARGCRHRTTRREGPYTIDMPKGPHRYYQVYCTDTCKAYLRNEDA